MKRFWAMILLVLVVLPLCACGQCNHEWTKATCTEPQYCSKCGLANGSPLGHDWRAATCEVPKTCARCGATEGVALGHSFADGVCTLCGAMDPAIPEPSSEPSPEPNPLVAIREEHAARMQAENEDLYVPDLAYFLEEPEVKLVMDPGGSHIYAMLKPDKDLENWFDNVYNNTQVTIIAKQNGYALFYTDGGFYAWGDYSRLVNENDTPYLVWGNGGGSRTMVVDYKWKIYVTYTPYAIFEHFALLSPGDVVTAYDTIGERTFVECGAVKGWVYSAFLSEP